MKSRQTAAWLACVMLGTACLEGAAQWTPAANAVKLPDSLIFTATTATNNATVVWHPVKQRYYSLRIGAAGFPLETWVEGSSTSVCAATTAIDTRGMWYNPSNGQIERNCMGAIGWATFGIDGASCATGAATTIFAGQLQATGQSCAAYDPVLNQVLSYVSATTSVQFRDRATGNVAQTLLLSGTSFATVNTESIIWTGQAGYEIGLLDWSNKRVLLFNRATGVFAGLSQLPASAVTHTQFRFCYTNNRVWLFNSTLRKWNAYCIWNQANCPSFILPVELLDLSARCVEGRAQIRWTTASETNSSHFEVESSDDLAEWEHVGRVPAAGHSHSVLEYALFDDEPGDGGWRYYRLRQVDLDGTEELSHSVASIPCDAGSDLLLHPNPATTMVDVSTTAVLDESGPWHLDVLDGAGREVLAQRIVGATTRVDLSGLGPGAYMTLLVDPEGRTAARARLLLQ